MMAHRPRRSIEPPPWLPHLEERVASLRTAEDWLHVLALLHRQLERLGLIPLDATKGVAVVTPSGNIGQVGGPYDYFLVNLSAPDGVLRKEFKNWLKAQRQEVAGPVRKRGSDAQDSDFGQDHFKNWRKLRIVEYGALLVWRARLPDLERKLATKTVIGKWTKRYGSNDRKRTMDRLKEVMAVLPALAAQAGAEKSAKLGRVSGAD